MIEITVEVPGQPEAMARERDVRHRGLRRFLHHVAEFAGKCQLAFAVDDRSFGAENRASDFGPGQAR